MKRRENHIAVTVQHCHRDSNPPDGSDTKHVITQRHLPNRNQLLRIAGGWHVPIGNLIDLPQDRTPRRFWPEHVRLNKVYEGRLAE